MGALIEQVPPAKGGRPKETGTGMDTSLSRGEVAREAGISKRQQVTALRLHTVPRESFERQVESANPPTMSELARQGTRSSLS
jgi:hypothetical protein